MSNLLTKQRPYLEAVPFFDAHASLSHPLRIRYIVEACAASQKMDRTLLNETLHALFAFHDLLRVHMFEDQSIMKLFITPAIPEEPVQWVDLASSSEVEQQNAIRETMDAVYRSLLHDGGFLCRFLYFDLGERNPGLFVVVIHHVLADGWSMRIISQDIQRVYLQLCAGKPPRLTPKTASFNEFATRLHRYLHQEFPIEMDYWRSLKSGIRDFPVDCPENRLVDPLTGGTLVRTSIPLSVSSALTQEETATLLRVLPAAKWRIEDLLLTGLMRAVANRLGESTLHVYSLHNGRTIFGELDVSHTIGCLAQGLWQYFQIDPDLSPIASLRSIIEQRQRIPRKGVGLSLAANCSEHRDPFWSRFCAAEDLDIVKDIYYSDNLMLNYLGKETHSFAKQELFVQADQRYRELVLIPETYEAEIIQEMRKPCKLHALVLIRNGQLFLVWEYDGMLYRTETMEALLKDHLDAIRAIVADFQKGVLR